MPSSSRTNDRQELDRIKRQVIWRLSRAPKSLRTALRELDFTDPLGPDLSQVVEYLVYTDHHYYNMCASTSRHASGKAERRRRLIIKAVIELRKEKKILTAEDRIVEPSALLVARRPKKRKKSDKRPFHGRPGRDRDRLLQHVTT